MGHPRWRFICKNYHSVVRRLIMAKYRNKKTGAVLETECKISGGNWEKVVAKNTSKKSDEKKSDEKKSDEQPENNAGSANEDEAQLKEDEDE